MPDSPPAAEGKTPLLPGGPPGWPRPDEDVRAALVAAYADGSWGKYAGPHSEQLIALLQTMCGTPHVSLCSSGTIAVELALRGLKVGPGDEVLLAGYDFPGNFRAIESVGARPVLIDLRPDSWVLDVNEVEAAIGAATKAVVASHLHGSLVEMRRLREIADRRGLSILEDACQVPGATIDDRPAGSWGDVGVLSFGGSKLLTAGRGGAVVSAREDVMQRVRVFSQRGNEAFPLSELQAAVLCPQLPKIAAANARRLANVRTLLKLAGDLPGLQPLALPQAPGNQPAFYKMPWLLGGNNTDCSSSDFEQRRRRFLAALQAEGVAMDEGFRGFARRTGNRCRVAGDLPQARRAAAGTVVLHHPVLLESEHTIGLVAAALRWVAQRALAD